MKSIRSLMPRNIITPSLNPILWMGPILRPEIYTILMKESKKFLRTLNIPIYKVSDIVLTGSQTSPDQYNMTSDIDVHFIMNDADEYVQKMKMWNSNNDLEVYGIPIEYYPEDPKAKAPKCQGRYSLMKRKWLQKPCYNKVPVESSLEYQIKLSHFMEKILLLTPKTTKLARRLKKQLKAMRSEGLKSSTGVNSVGNSVFRSLRRLGYLEKLHNLL